MESSERTFSVRGQASCVTSLSVSVFKKNSWTFKGPKSLLKHLCNFCSPFLHLYRNPRLFMFPLLPNEVQMKFVDMVIAGFRGQCYPRCFFRHLQVRWIVQESPIYHRVEESLLYQNPLSVNLANFHFPTILLNSFQSLKTGIAEFWNELLTKLVYRVQLQL